MPGFHDNAGIHHGNEPSLCGTVNMSRFTSDSVTLADLIADESALAGAVARAIAADDLAESRRLTESAAKAVGKSGSRIGWALALAGFGIAIGLAMPKPAGWALAGVAVVAAGVLAWRARAIRVEAERLRTSWQPKVRLTSLRYGVLPLEWVEAEEGAYLCDRSELFPETVVPLPTGETVARLAQLVESLRAELTTMPAIVAAEPVREDESGTGGGQRRQGEEAALADRLAGLQSALDQLELRGLGVRFLDAPLPVLDRFLQLDQAGGCWREAPEVRLVDASERAQDRARIARIEELLVTDGGNAASRRSGNLRVSLADLRSLLTGELSALGAARQGALDEILHGYAIGLERCGALANYHCYCPDCNSETITILAAFVPTSDIGAVPRLDRATRLTPVAGTTRWACPVCEKQTDRPFPQHRLLDELIHPVLDRLLLENRAVRLQLYADAEERKATILREEQRELRGMVEACEREGRDIEARAREIAARVESARGTVNILLAEMAAFEALKQSRLSAIGRDLEATVQRVGAYRAEAMSTFNQAMDRIEVQSRAGFAEATKVARLEFEAQMDVQQQIAQSIMTLVHQAGGDKPRFPDVFGQISHKFGDMKQAVSGQSDYDRMAASVQKPAEINT